MEFDLTIRPARTSDIALIHNLVDASFDQMKFLAPESRKSRQKSFGLTFLHNCLAVDDAIILVASDPTDRVDAVAIMRYEGGVIQITHAAVRPGLQRKGLGTIFVREIFKIAKSLSAHKIYGFIRTHDVASQMLASREGFSMVASCKRWWDHEDYAMWEKGI